jgi:hypothetical protein
MKIALRAVLLVGLLALGFWAWTVFFPNPQRAVRNQLKKLARLASSSPREGNLARGLDAQRLGGMFSDDVHIMVNISERGTFNLEGRDELMRGLLMAKAPGNGGQVEFLDIKIEMGTANLSALVDLTLKATFEGQSDTVFQEMKFTLKKIKGDWLITSVETVSTLKP